MCAFNIIIFVQILYVNVKPKNKNKAILHIKYYNIKAVTINDKAIHLACSYF